jgi:rod shape-determining protein MreC
MNQRRFSKTFYLFSVLAVILLLIFFNYLGWLGSVKNIIYQASAPFMKLFQSVDRQIAGAFNFWTELKKINQENKDLGDENRRLLDENASLKEVLKENELLRQRLGITPPVQEQLVMADIVSYLPQLGQYFLIDKGSQQGLKEGMAVITANNFFVGQLIEVGDRWAKGTLVLDSNLLVNVLTQETRIRGIVRGNHGLGLIMEMIPIDAQIAVGENILTSGINDKIPGGLIVGQISAIEKKESEIFQQAILQPAVDFNKLEKVFVIISAGN